MSWNCTARHIFKDDFYYFGDGEHILYNEHVCPSVVTEKGAMCATHQKNRSDEKYNHGKLCQWNYAFKHGQINETYNAESRVYGSPYYNYWVSRYGMPKESDLEKAIKCQEEVQHIVKAMQLDIRTFIKGADNIVSKTTIVKHIDSPTPKMKRIKSKKSIDDSSKSTTSSESSISFIETLPVANPKHHIRYIESDSEPITISLSYVRTIEIIGRRGPYFESSDGVLYAQDAEKRMVEVSEE